MTDEQIAHIIHEAHRALQAADPVRATHQIPAPPWVALPRWNRETVIALVGYVRANWTAPMVHEAWVMRMMGAGWTWGPVKDPLRKEHPNLVAWEKLDWDEQLKTLQAVAIAKVHIGS